MGNSVQPTVLLVGFPEGVWEEYRKMLQGLALEVVQTEEAARAAFETREVAVVCVGPKFPGEQALGLLMALMEGQEEYRAANIVLQGGDDLALFLPLIEEEKLLFVTPRPIPPDELRKILTATVARYRSSQEPTASPVSDIRLHDLLTNAQQVASHSDVVSMSLSLREVVAELFRASRAYCLFYDRDTESLWSVGLDGQEERRETAAVGLTSFVARTGESIVVDQVDTDPRYDPDADDPEGGGEERFLAVPLRGPGGRCIGVLVAVRPPEQEAFTPATVGELEILGDHVGPPLSVKLNRWVRAARGDLQATETPEFSTRLFRRSAVERFRQGERGEGDVLRISPVWMTLVYRLLLLVLGAGLLFGVLGTVRQYASGPAVVQLGNKNHVTATNGGTVTGVEVGPGDAVTQGQLLIRFYGAEESAELSRIENEFKLQLRRHLRDPGDQAPEQALLALRSQRELARARLEQRFVRSPASGVVGDVRVQEGQYLIPGQVLLTLAGQEQAPELVALLPGHFRPQLAPGMMLRFELDGYRYQYQQLEITSVGQEIVGPTEAQRILGQAIGDAVTVQGPVVPVYARIATDHFDIGGEALRYHDGMWGRAEVSVRSERIVVTLVPALRTLFGGEGG